MQLQYLGTAAAEGWPAPFCDCPICTAARKNGIVRSRTQSLLNGELLLDWPPDGTLHMAQNGINLRGLRALLITHSHMDHCFMEELVHRAAHFSNKAPGVLTVYGNAAVHSRFEAALGRKNYADHPVADCLRFREVHAGLPFVAAGWQITPLAADHDPGEECLIYILQKQGKTVLYAHDTGPALAPAARAVLSAQRFDLISLDATMGQKTIGRYHMGLADVSTFAAALKAEGALKADCRCVINHFSHNGGMTDAALQSWARENGFLCAYDGQKVEF